MEYKNETKTCQNCKNDFTIDSEDFSFYEKIKVPPPTFCPECRRQRRLAWMNIINLYKRDCDLCKVNFISMYPKEADLVVYCPKCWWSDGWDWRDYGIDFNESKTFFEQFHNLLRLTPLLGLSINANTTPNSPYNNHAQDLKNCYLTFLTSFNEYSAYGFLVTRNKEVFDCSMVMDCDSCFDCMNIFKSSRCVGTRGNARFSLECWFNRDCDNCTECIGCVNLRNKSYHIFNQPYSKEEYFKIKKSIDLGSYEAYQELQKKAQAFWLEHTPKPAYDDMSVDYTGSYVFGSKNCKECYDVTGAENSKYMLMIYNEPVKDSYDLSSWGGNISLSYEGSIIGENSANILFSQETGINSFDIEYSKLAFNSSHLFGSVSVKKGEYVILNKQYSKEEYLKLREKIIEQMSELPYESTTGALYKYGEFFPPEISPFPYNKTMAQFFYPLSKEEVEAKKLWWQEEEKSQHPITKSWLDLPDNIKNTTESVLKEVFECRDCSKGFRITEIDLSFLKKMKLPLPRTCPFCRIKEKINLWVDNMSLKARVCDQCKISFKTHYSKERAPVIYCKKCYQKEMY